MDPRPHPDELDALCAAYALDALDDATRARVEAWIRDDGDVAARVAALHEVAARLSSPVVTAPAARPALERARRVRAAGRSLLGPSAPSSLAAVHATRAAALAELLGSLEPADWDVPTRLGRPVRAVLAHLAGQLERTATELGDGAFVEPDPDDYDHWGSTEPYIARHREPTEIRAALADVNARIALRLVHLDGDVHDLATPAARALGKVFELWMHADDVRVALGRPVEVPDAADLLTMCTLAADVLPFTMALSGTARPDAHARLVLTGRGGGVSVTPLAPTDAARTTVDTPSDVTIVAEAHSFCRLFHRQVEPADVVRSVEGDEALGRVVLASVGALAENT